VRRAVLARSSAPAYHPDRLNALNRLSRAVLAATRDLAPVVLAACGEEGPPGGRPRLPPAIELPLRAGPCPIRFVDGTAASGVDFVHENGFDREGWFYVEQFGSGVAAFDADGDEDVDLYFLSGRRLSGAPQEPPPRNRFYRNLGDGRFVDATDESGLGDTRYSLGVCAADYDNDGDLDLYVTNFDEPNALYRNDRRGRFEDVAAAAGARGRDDALDTVCAFADVDGDGHVDLFVGCYGDHSRRRNDVCHIASRIERGRMLRAYCPPRTFAPLPDLLLRNRGDGTFEDATERAGLAGFRGRSLGIAFGDYDDDGDADAFVACDNTPNYLLVNDGRGRFRDVADEAGVALDHSGAVLSGMGASCGDFDRDGRLDIVATYFEREWNGLYHNRGALEFGDVAVEAGTARASFHYLGWGCVLADLDLDGLPDWVVANGRLQPDYDQLYDSPIGYRQPLLVQLNRGGRRFESLDADAGEAVARLRAGRGLAAADLDGDGDLDLALNNNQEPAELLRNESPRDGRHWLLVKVVGSASNRAGIGARVAVTAAGRTQVAEVASGQSYLSQGDLRLHFGLGASVVDRLEVRWPSGRRSLLESVAADRLTIVVEPER